MFSHKLFSVCVCVIFLVTFIYCWYVIKMLSLHLCELSKLNERPGHAWNINTIFIEMSIFVGFEATITQLDCTAFIATSLLIISSWTLIAMIFSLLVVITLVIRFARRWSRSGPIVRIIRPSASSFICFASVSIWIIFVAFRKLVSVLFTQLNLFVNDVTWSASATMLLSYHQVN